MKQTWPEPLMTVLRRQDGVASQGQLIGCGVSRSEVRWNGGRGWRELLPNVFLVSRETPTLRQRLIALQLWAGPTSALDGLTGARWHGIRSAEPGGILHSVVEPPRAARRTSYARLRRSILHDENVVEAGVLRVSSPARACIDAAFSTPTRQGREALLIEAVQRGIATIDDLAEWMMRLRTRDAHRIIPALDAAASGAWSVPERELLHHLDGHPLLPPAWANPVLEEAQSRLHLVSPDIWFDDVAMAVMVHSEAYHRGALWDATVSRDGDLTAVGIVVVGVTPHAIRHKPETVLARIVKTYAAAARRPRPAVVARRRFEATGDEGGLEQRA